MLGFHVHTGPDLAEHLLERDGVPVQLGRSILQGAHLLDRLDESLHPLARGDDVTGHVREVPVGFLLQHGSETEDDGDRRPQLVRGDGHEVALELVESGEAVVDFAERVELPGVADRDGSLRRYDEERLDVGVGEAAAARVERFEHADGFVADPHRHAEQGLGLDARGLGRAFEVARVMLRILHEDGPVLAENRSGDTVLQRHDDIVERIRLRAGRRLEVEPPGRLVEEEEGRGLAVEELRRGLDDRAQEHVGIVDGVERDAEVEQPSRPFG